MPVAVVGAVASVAGAAISKRAGDKAAQAQTQAADASIAEQRRQYDQTREDQMPWLEQGRNALAQLNDPNAFQASPGYGFVRDEGNRGIERTAAARGGAFSGNALRALNEFNSNLASQEYGNWWNRTASQAGIGQQTAQSLGAAGQATANNVGNALMNRGDARASGIINSANSINNGLSGLTQAYGQWREGRNTLAPVQVTGAGSRRMPTFGTPPFNPYGNYNGGGWGNA